MHDERPDVVAVVVNDLQPYGAQRVAISIAREMSALKEVKLITLEPPGDPHELEVPDHIPVVSLDRQRRGGIGYAELVLRMRRCLMTTAPQAVISHMMFSNLVTLGAVASIRRSPRVVITEHSVPRGLDAERSPAVLKRLARILYPTAHRIVGVSDGVVRGVADEYGISESKLRRIYNPIDVDRMRSVMGPMVHPWLAGAREERAFVCVAGFRPAKGHEVLLEAMALMSESARLVLVGDGPLRPRMESFASRMGLEDRVDFVGFSSAASAYMAAARAVVIPSQWEGFGLVAVEAGAVGAYVVASDVDGLRELVPAFVSGVRVPPNDPRALAAVLDGLGPVNGSLSDCDTFDPKTVASRYESVANGEG
jgi:glycosyltransferase involved in cell wall biosynthesis